MKHALALMALLSIAGCTNVPELVVMQNPKTKEVVQCRHDPWLNYNREDVRNCVDGYTKAGWVNLTQQPSPEPAQD